MGGETAYEGKICRSCLGKKQRGETINSNQNQPKPITNEPNLFAEPPVSPRMVRDDYHERKYLFRELNRKKSSRNNYLTSFFINLFVFQWLIPLIVIIFLWISLKDNMKVQALNNPGMGLTTEIPFTTVIKDFFKILTSENYVFGGHTILISVAWKIGIVSAFLVPLITWIYSLVRFFGFKGEVEQLETEIESTKR